MKYRAVAGHSAHELCLVIECSGCGMNLRFYEDAIAKRRLRFCPACGRKLVQRRLAVPYDEIVDMLNKNDVERKGVAE